MVADELDYVVGVDTHRDEAVLEVGRAPRSERRLRGKNDELDAVRAARAVLAHEPLARPRSGERREALRLLLIARRSAVDVRARRCAASRSESCSRALLPPAPRPDRDPG
jgi:hypothetical protein